MNLLLIGKDELVEGGSIEVRGPRARHIRKVLRLSVGDGLRVGRIDGPLGRGILQSVEHDRVVLTPEWGELPPAPSPNVLVLAMARPPMLRRALFQAVGIGVRRIHVIRSARVEKSYFQSSILHDGGVEEAIRLGLEQAVDTRWPELEIHDRFRPFVEDRLPGELEGESVGLLAHPGQHPPLGRVLPAGHRGGAVMAVGPEGGWLPFELELFEKVGMRPFSMGARILRVDTAVPALLAQVELIRSLDL